MKESMDKRLEFFGSMQIGVKRCNDNMQGFLITKKEVKDVHGLMAYHDGELDGTILDNLL